MRTVMLKRLSSSDEGTIGFIETDTKLTWRTGELPWRNNTPFQSCVPEGVYTCRWLPSDKLGECYHLMRVPGRSAIEIHSANFMGDMNKGYRSDLLGCIAVGKELGTLVGQQALLHSRAALAEFESEMNQLDFQLTIVDIFQHAQNLG